MTSILDNPAIRRAVLRVSVEQYHRLGETGVITGETELLKGVIVEKMIKSPIHSWLVQFLVEWLRTNVSSGVYVRQEQPLTFTDSEPEPDVAVVSGGPDDYRSAHPSTAVLVIEVAVSSGEIDRAKSKLYAAASVAEYLIVLPDEKRAELHTRPEASGYCDRRTLQSGDVLTLTCVPHAALEISEILRD